MKRLTLKHDDPPIHKVGAATATPRWTIHLRGTEPDSFFDKTAALDLTLNQLINLRDRLNIALEEEPDAKR